ncbi:MAG: hypothetical protein AB8G14_18875 [Ilumatobacter sp.]
MLAPFAQLTTGHWVFDGELVGTKLVIFGLAEATGIINDTTGFLDRHRTLVTAAAVLLDGATNISIAPIAQGEFNEILFAEAQDSYREGVILRRAAGRYTAGRSDSLIHYKFVKESDVVITEIGRGGKNNIVVALHDTDGNLVEVGKITATGKGDLAAGDVVTVRYLYVTDPTSPKLFQPRIIRPRTDKPAIECVLAQLDGHHTNKIV